jgi:hypothetical protein
LKDIAAISGEIFGGIGMAACHAAHRSPRHQHGGNVGSAFQNAAGVMLQIKNDGCGLAPHDLLRSPAELAQGGWHETADADNPEIAPSRRAATVVGCTWARVMGT